MTGLTRNQKCIYCKFRNIHKNFVFPNSIKAHICDVRNSQHGHYIRISVNDSVILAFPEGFIITKLRICVYAKFRDNKTLAKISEFKVLVVQSTRTVLCVCL